MTRTLIFLLFSAGVAGATAAHAQELSTTARDVVQCRSLSDPEVRLACYDAAADKMAGALEQARSATSGTKHSPERDDSTTPRTESNSAPDQSGDAKNQQASEQSAAPPSDSEVPVWAAPPARTPEEAADDPDVFQATIVRITRNNVGRHWFYTEDGAVWEQTQIEEIRPPKSLPAIATFKKKLTGNPVIKFDVSNRAYRVRRVE